MLDDSACGGEVPEKEKTCELRPCEGVDWVVSPWSGVSFKTFAFILHELRCYSVSSQLNTLLNRKT